MAASTPATRSVKGSLSCPFAGRQKRWVRRVGLLLAGCASLMQAQTPPVKTASLETSPVNLRLEAHRQPAWQIMIPHLPDQTTGSPQALETAADVLRARRFPEDAVEYYIAALRRGGDEERLMNKIAVTEISLRQTTVAKTYLKALTKKHKKNAEGWNNLGAAEYMDGRIFPALSAYRKAVKLSPQSAVFHVNLGTALVERKQYEEARREMAKALDLDPDLGKNREDIVGMQAHVLSANDRAEYCFEMAKVYAGRKQIELMLNSLAMALENGMDVQEKMARDPDLERYVADARFTLMVANWKAQHKPDLAKVSGPLQPLPPAAN